MQKLVEEHDLVHKVSTIMFEYFTLSGIKKKLFSPFTNK